MNCALYYEQIGQEKIEKARQEICITAEMLDPNKTVHNILRLTSGEARINNVKGRLGGSLVLLTMAEMLRRAEEEVFNVRLPEEDELGFGIVFRDTRRELYGSERLLDGDRRVADEFIRQQGLDSGVRVRWYCEGETEYYAVESVLGDFLAIQLINLRGRVAERGEVAVFATVFARISPLVSSVGSRLMAIDKIPSVQFARRRRMMKYAGCFTSLNRTLSSRTSRLTNWRGFCGSLLLRMVLIHPSEPACMMQFKVLGPQENCSRLRNGLCLS